MQLYWGGGGLFGTRQISTKIFDNDPAQVSAHLKKRTREGSLKQWPQIHFKIVFF
jgi:hypothetical protein